MPYYSGNVASLAALATAVRAACVAEGWTLHGTEVLSKSGAFFRVWAEGWGTAFPYLNGSGSATGGGQNYATAPQLYVVGGTGVDGSNNLTGKRNGTGSRLGPQFAAFTDASKVYPFAFPMDYEIFINDSPDEVYVVVNHDSDMYQHIAFGHSPLAQATGGTGAWFGGSMNPIPNLTGGPSTSNWLNAGAAWMVQGSNNVAWSYQAPAPLFFAWNTYDANSAQSDAIASSAYMGSSTDNVWAYNYWIHTGVETVGWNKAGSTNIIYPMLVRGPNQYNSNAPLLRAVAAQCWSDLTMQSVVVEIEHARLLRIDNFTPEDIITLGADQWKVFPWFQRNLSQPNGSGSAIRHTGALGWAIRYDGP